MKKINTQMIGCDINAQNIKFVGRWLREQDHAEGYWSGTYMEVVFTGHTFGLILNQKANLSVTADGGDAQYVAGADGEVDLSLYLDTTKDVHTLRVALPDDTVDCLCVQALVIGEDATLLPPREKLLIEIIGDSITAGAFYKPQSANTYACMTGRLLDVDYAPVSLGGLSLIQGLNGNRGAGICTPETASMATRYFWTKPLDRHEKNDPWQFSAYTPHLVLINLGTNDGLSQRADEAEFIKTYTDFVQKLREKYGQEIPIILVIPVKGFMKEAITAVHEGLKQAHTYLVDATEFLVGADIHPTPEGHMVIAEKMADAIRRVWEQEGVSI